MIALRNPRRRGVAAVLAMLFLVLMTTLAAAMYSMEAINVQSAYNLSDVARAQAAAETGVRWIGYRFVRMARPKTTIGHITPAVAEALWPPLKQAIIDDLTTSGNKMLDPTERPVTATADSLKTSPIKLEAGGATFQVTITRSADDARILNVASTGRYGSAARTVSMQFKIDKKIKFAVVGKVPIQLGRNTIVEGPIAMGTPTKFPPLLMLSDFMHFDTTLANRLNQWNAFLQAHHDGFDNRISVNNAAEYAAASSANFRDRNGDAYIDEWDFFLERFDANNDKAVTRAEFTKFSTGKLYDENLFEAIDSSNGPMFDGDSTRQGYNDGVLDNSDAYAKLHGNVLLAPTADAWTANLAGSGKDINDMIQGTVVTTEPGMVPVLFGVNPTDMIDLNPSNFEACAANYRAKSGSAGGALVSTSSVKANLTLTAAMANGGSIIEESPKGSKAFQAVYKRPIFKNMTIRNCIIPKGLNPLFQNCTFEGVTFVDTEHDVKNTSGSVIYDSGNGMTWARQATSSSSSVNTSGDFKDTNGDGKWDQYKINGMSSYANLTTDASGNKVLPSGAGSFAYGPGGSDKKSLGSLNGNNVRFDGCTFNGPLAGNYATAYSHFANSWEFTGATMFDNQIDQTATIVSPQVNIEMGSFTNPGSAPSTLVGVVVVGNIDIRGTSSVDGSIIVTGDGAGNTTLAYFGASDGDTDPGALPEGGYGRLNIRYNPMRALPDGINISIDVLPVRGTYSENVK
jgi:hypothetical protein